VEVRDDVAAFVPHESRSRPDGDVEGRQRPAVVHGRARVDVHDRGRGGAEELDRRLLVGSEVAPRLDRARTASGSRVGRRNGAARREPKKAAPTRSRSRRAHGLQETSGRRVSFMAGATIMDTARSISTVDVP
jgi:hypothetical protein